jgi:hypothetical protein
VVGQNQALLVSERLGRTGLRVVVAGPHDHDRLPQRAGSRHHLGCSAGASRFAAVPYGQQDVAGVHDVLAGLGVARLACLGGGKLDDVTGARE